MCAHCVSGTFWLTLFRAEEKGLYLFLLAIGENALSAFLKSINVVNISIVANALCRLSNGMKMNLSNESQMKELRTQMIFRRKWKDSFVCFFI